MSLGELKAGWEDQLKHQLQILPPVESFYSELRSALLWWMDNEPELSLARQSQIIQKKNHYLAIIFQKLHTSTEF